MQYIERPNWWYEPDTDKFEEFTDEELEKYYKQQCNAQE